MQLLEVPSIRAPIMVMYQLGQEQQTAFVCFSLTSLFYLISKSILYFWILLSSTSLIFNWLLNISFYPTSPLIKPDQYLVYSILVSFPQNHSHLSMSSSQVTSSSAAPGLSFSLPFFYCAQLVFPKVLHPCGPSPVTARGVSWTTMLSPISMLLQVLFQARMPCVPILVLYPHSCSLPL